jgi:NADH dehydrogenase
VDVLLLDRSGYHLFTPLLYQVATALLNPSEIAYPLRALFRKSPNVRVSTTKVTSIDLGRRVVHASPSEEIPYDYVVLATGSTNNYHGNLQLAENSNWAEESRRGNPAAQSRAGLPGTRGLRDRS